MPSPGGGEATGQRESGEWPGEGFRMRGRRACTAPLRLWKRQVGAKILGQKGGQQLECTGRESDTGEKGSDPARAARGPAGSDVLPRSAWIRRRRPRGAPFAPRHLYT